MHFPNKKIIEPSFIEMGLFYEHFTFGQSETQKIKYCANIYPMICSTVFLLL